LYTPSNLKRFEKTWDEKKPTAFFRGTATGGGVTPETNQRLQAALYDYQWNKDGHPYKDYINAKITGWNMRDKKIAGVPMTYINQSYFPFDNKKNLKANYTPIYEQSSYKYLIYIEGHCAACRYGFLMKLGCVILKVESKCVADQMWYFSILQPYVDHVPVKADLSDLAEKIEWCRSHDAECEQIAHNAKMLNERYLSRDGVLDYMQVCMLLLY
jgi:hypothetical protein